MGRVHKDFVATAGRRVVSACGQVDSGADTTVLDVATACALGFDPRRVPRRRWRMHGVVGGTLVAGPTFDVRLRVGRKQARIRAFVPLEHGRFRRDGRWKGRPAEGENLIGADFLQRARARLDYRKPHGSVFSGWQDRWPGEKVMPAPASVVDAIRRRSRCP